MVHLMKMLASGTATREKRDVRRLREWPSNVAKRNVVGRLVAVVVLLAAVVVPASAVGAQTVPSPVTGPSGGASAPVAVAGAGQATLTWLAPTDDGGSSIVRYEYTYSFGVKRSEEAVGVWYQIPGSTGSTTSYVVTGLKNGTSYIFQLRAVNADGRKGDSDAVRDSNPVIPTTVPQAPGGLEAEPGESMITLKWTLRNGETVETGWSEIIRYEYQRKIGDRNWGSWSVIPDSDKDSQQFVVTGLSNGVNYRFKLRAVNDNGAGPEAETKTVVVSGTPGSPRAVSAVPGNESVTLSWSPSGDGGSPITAWEYRYAASSGDITTAEWVRIPGSASRTSYVVTGLSNDLDYQFQVRAVNANGVGTASTATEAVHPGGVPPAPPVDKLDQTLGEDSITLQWAGPRDSDGEFDNGGSPIIRYEYQRKVGSGAWSTWMTIPASETYQTGANSEDLALPDTIVDRTYKITGLTQGSAYLFRIRAVNRIGAGAYVETPDALYPGTVPSAPSSFSARTVWDERKGVASVVLSWTPGSNGGSPITGWEYKGASDLSTLSSATWTYLCDGTGETTYLNADTTTKSQCEGLRTITLPRTLPDGSKPDTTINPGLTGDYNFVIRAVNSFGKGLQSSVVGVRPGGSERKPGAPLGVSFVYYADAPSSGGQPRAAVVAGLDSTGTTSTNFEYSWKVDGGAWGRWAKRTAEATDAQTWESWVTKFEVGKTYQMRVRHFNDNGSGPVTESPPFVYGAPLLPGGGAFYGSGGGSTGAATGAFPVLKVVPGSGKVTLSLRDTDAANSPISTRSQMDNLGGTVRWEYSYKVGNGAWDGWTFVNEGEQFNGGAELEIDGLRNGLVYRFRIRAVVGELGGIVIETKEADTETQRVVPGVAPSAPWSLSAAGGDRTVLLSWSAPTGANQAITKWQYCDLSSGCDDETNDGGNDWKDVPGGGDAVSVTVRNLTNGVAYTFRVRAVNAIGPGAVAQTLPVTPGRVPAAPARVSVSPGDGMVTMTVVKPAGSGAGANRVVGYQVRKQRGNEPWDTWESLGDTVAASAGESVRPSAERSVTLTNLRNGVGYVFQVRAVNSYGPGAHRQTSTVTPIGAPTAGMLAAAPGDGQVALSWSGTGSGGSTITGWQYRQRQGTDGYGAWIDIDESVPSTRTHTVTGLSNGIGYRFSVRATTNTVSGNPFESETVTPSAVPPQPTVTAVGGNSEVKLSWTAGTSGAVGTATWASPTTGWQHRMQTGDGEFGAWSEVADSDTTERTITGLVNGTKYTFEVRAINVMGEGAAGSGSATPATVPPAPTLDVAPRDMEVVLAWTPNGNGGSDITGWQMRTDDGEWTDLGSASMYLLSVSELDNGQEYTFHVRAVNAVGEGEHATATATPAGTPLAPTVTSEAGDMSVSLSWTSNGDNGSAITAWQVRTGAGDWTDLDMDADGHTISDLVNGEEYTFGVRAVNAVGDGEVATETATPATTPSAPTVSATAGDGWVAVSWESTGDGGSAIITWQYRIKIGVADYGDWFTVDDSFTSFRLDELNAGTGAVEYVFEVKATNSVGDGPAATSDVVVPTAVASVDDDYYSGVVTGPDFCANRSLGGARLFALDGDGDGVADTCSLPYTRREAIARQNAVIALVNRYPDLYRSLVNAACADVEINRSQACGGRNLRVPDFPPMHDGTPYYSGSITGPSYCANRSLGGLTTYPLDSDGDGVADVCSLPYTRREAIARQKAGDTLSALYLDEFKAVLAEECLRLQGVTYGDDPSDLANDVCGAAAR